MLLEVHDVQEPRHLMAPDIALGWRETMTLSMGEEMAIARRPVIQ